MNAPYFIVQFTSGRKIILPYDRYTIKPVSDGLLQLLPTKPGTPDLIFSAANVEFLTDVPTPGMPDIKEAPNSDSTKVSS